MLGGLTLSPEVDVLGSFDNWLVFRPTSARQSWIAPPSHEIHDINLTAAGTSIHAWWLPCPGATDALLYLHGNAGNLSHRGASLFKLRALLNTSVLIIDYPGYGKSGGRVSETGCYAAADAAYAWLTHTAGCTPENIILYGASLGGGVAVDLARRRPHRGLVLLKAFTSIPDVGAYYYPWLPVRLLTRNRFDNLTKIRACHRPVFIAHGTADTVIPYCLGQRLFEAANEPKQFFTMPGDDHGDPLPEAFFVALQSFLAAIKPSSVA